MSARRGRNEEAVRAALDRCTAAAAAHAAVERERIAAARAAIEAGAPKLRVAAILGVTRQTLDRWIGAWERTDPEE